VNVPRHSRNILLTVDRTGIHGCMRCASPPAIPCPESLVTRMIEIGELDVIEATAGSVAEPWWGRVTQYKSRFFFDCRLHS
jgi:hypothetical protein